MDTLEQKYLLSLSPSCMTYSTQKFLISRWYQEYQNLVSVMKKVFQFTELLKCTEQSFRHQVRIGLAQE